MILKKLPTFDPSKGAKFLTYMYEFIGDALTSFRMREECWTTDSLDIYKGIRRIAAIHNASGGDAAKATEKFSKNTGCKSETAADYLERAVGIRAMVLHANFHHGDSFLTCQEKVLPPMISEGAPSFII